MATAGARSAGRLRRIAAAGLSCAVAFAAVPAAGSEPEANPFQSPADKRAERDNAVEAKLRQLLPELERQIAERVAARLSEEMAAKAAEAAKQAVKSEMSTGDGEFKALLESLNGAADRKGKPGGQPGKPGEGPAADQAEHIGCVNGRAYYRGKDRVWAVDQGSSAGDCGR